MSNYLNKNLNAIPVYQVDASGNTVSPAGDASGTFLSANYIFVETSTPLAAGATYTGPQRVAGAAPATRFCYFTADVWADQAGTIYVERSVDGGTWRPANGSAGQALAAGNSLQVKIPMTGVLYRVRFTNGSTAQGAFLLTTAYSLS